MRALFKGFIVNSLGLFLLKITGLILSVFVARNLGVLEFGLYSSSLAGIVLFGNSIAIALGMTTSNFYANSDKEIENYESSVYLLGILFVLSYTFLLTLFFFFTKDWLFSNYSYYFPVLIFSVLFYAPVFGIINAKEKYSRFGIYAFLGSTLFFISLASSVVFKLFSIDLALFLYVLPYVIIGILLHLNIIRDLGGVSRALGSLKSLNVKQLASYFKENLFLSFSSGAVSFALWYGYNHVEIGDDVLQNVALFASSMQWSFLFSQFSVVIGSVLVSKLMHGNKKLLAFNRYSSWLPVCIMASVVILIPEIHMLVFGEGFSTQVMSPLLNIVLLATVFNALKSSLQRSIIAKNISWLSTLGNFIWLILFITSTSVLEVSDVYIFAMLFLLSNMATFVLMMPLYLRFEVFKLSDYFSVTSIVLFFQTTCVVLVSFLDLDIFYRFLFLVLINALVLFVFFVRFSKNMSITKRS